MHNLPKTYATVKWFRPVQQNPEITQWLENPSSLLDWRAVGKGGATQRVPASKSWSDPYNGIEHQATVSTNIFRRSWSLSTRPATYQEELQNAGQRQNVRKRDRASHQETLISTASENKDESQNWRTRAIPTAWEEKATVFVYDQEIAPIGAYHAYGKLMRHFFGVDNT